MERSNHKHPSGDRAKKSTSQEDPAGAKEETYVRPKRKEERQQQQPQHQHRRQDEVQVPITKPSRKKVPAPKKPPTKPEGHQNAQSKPQQQQQQHSKKARDSNLHHLGRMSPEEQVDKFLQSVEEVNAESEVKKEKNGAIFSKNKKLRTAADHASSVGAAGAGANRWRSMDNLTVAATGKDARPKLPPFNRPVQAPAGPVAKSKEAGVRHKKPFRQDAPPPRVGFREINGPKSFASLGELDRIHDGGDLLGGKAGRKPPRRQETASSKTGSSTEEGRAKRKKKQLERSEEEERQPSIGSIDNQGGRSKAPSLSPSPSPRPVSSSSSSVVRTKVAYLGKLPLSSQASNLASLQLPLKELYFDFIRAAKSGQRPHKSALEITETGLRINCVRERQQQQPEIFNPFRTIAVWAAVRFIYKREVSDGKSRFLFAFLPLISDPGDAENDQVCLCFFLQTMKLRRRLCFLSKEVFFFCSRLAAFQSSFQKRH